MLFDTVIKNIEVFDGSGKPSYFADVALNDDRIANIGQIIGEGTNNWMPFLPHCYKGFSSLLPLSHCSYSC